nr:hypothetical protein [Cyanobacteria bacterium UBA8530]
VFGPSPLPVLSPTAVSSASLAISLNYRLGATRLSINAKGKTLSYQLSHGYAPPRLSIRVPRGSFEGPLPVPCGETLNLAYRQEGESVLFEVGLPEGPFEVEEQKKNDAVTFLWKPQPRPKVLPLVVIDPGHGGMDPGAVGPTGLRESQVNLELALKLKDELKKLNVDSVLTRESDVFVDLAPRSTFAEGLNARMLVSLHCNSYPGSEATGAESYYRLDGSIPLAKTLHNALIEDLGRPDRGVRQARLYVLRSSLIPSALLETAFISNPNEEAILKDQEFQGQAAKAIAGGIWQYLFAPATPELTP